MKQGFTLSTVLALLGCLVMLTGFLLRASQTSAESVGSDQRLQAIEVVLTGELSQAGNRSLDQLGKKLQEMKEILDIW